MKILIIDNYDSFTYNLVQLVEQITENTVDVVKNDQINLDEILNYDALILSPGPGIPEEAGLLLQIIQEFAKKIPMLGVCLGHQAMIEAFGGSLLQLETVYHGIGSELKIIQPHFLYNDLQQPIQIGRYHSWVADKINFPKDFEITATDANDIIMSVQHKTLPLTGVQFHPESILTPQGKKMIQNWLNSIQ